MFGVRKSVKEVCARRGGAMFHQRHSFRHDHRFGASKERKWMRPDGELKLAVSREATPEWVAR